MARSTTAGAGIDKWSAPGAQDATRCGRLAGGQTPLVGRLQLRRDPRRRVRRPGDAPFVFGLSEPGIAELMPLPMIIEASGLEE